ncbi:RHS repeat-associated core domain-containing protein [Acinetobacter stercoris]
MLVDNSSNAVVWQWESTAFGGGKPTGSVTFNLRFPGQYYDEFTGLHYNLHRYYNPELGRYMEPDPIGLEGGLNPYAYAYNNPITYVDLTGEHPVIIAMGVGAGMSSAFYVGKVGINAFIEAKKNNQDLVGGTWDNLRNSFSWTEMGQQAALGAAFGGIGKAAFLAADVHVAKTALSENATLMQKAANWGGNLATNKTREFTTNAGFVITSNLLVSKTSANLAISSYNEQRAIARMNQQLAYQEFYRKFYQQYNNQVPIIDLGTLPVIRIQANGTEAQARQQIQIGINQYFH